MASSARSGIALRMPCMNRRCHSWGIWPLPPLSVVLLVRTEMPITSNVATSALAGLDALGAGLGAFCAESDIARARMSADATSKWEVKRDLSFIVVGECTHACAGLTSARRGGVYTHGPAPASL